MNLDTARKNAAEDESAIGAADTRELWEVNSSTVRLAHGFVKAEILFQDWINISIFRSVEHVHLFLVYHAFAKTDFRHRKFLFESEVKLITLGNSFFLKTFILLPKT